MQRDHRVFILEYHDVCETGRESEGVISQERFDRHLTYLCREYELDSVAGAVDRLVSGQPLERDVVVITFDDGYEGNYSSAWPVLRKWNQVATLFVTTGFLDGQHLWFDEARRFLGAARALSQNLSATLIRSLESVFVKWPSGLPLEGEVESLKRVSPELRSSLLEELQIGIDPVVPPAQPLSWSQVREMRALGIEIGAHTISHPLLAQLSPTEQRREIEGSWRRIEEELGAGAPPTTFAYPNGSERDFDATTVGLVRDCGFSSACTTMRGSNRPGADVYRLRRIGMGSDSIAMLRLRLSGLLDIYLKKTQRRCRSTAARSLLSAGPVD